MRPLRHLRVPLLVVALSAALAGCDQSQSSDSAKAKNDGANAAKLPPGELIREAKGVELEALSEPQRETFFTMINQEESACGQAHSLAKSLRDDPGCRDSLLVAQFIAKRLGAGATPGDIKQSLDELTDALKPVEINVEGRPVFGNPSAPVTMVVFADFQCPHCKVEAPALREEVRERRGQVNLVFKHFPLRGQSRSEVAAIATEAAHSQGKFWEMHDLVFANQTTLEDADLERFARQIPELDFDKWKADFAAETTKAAVNRDRADGKAAELTGTPTVFVNGRRVTSLLWDGKVSAWIDDALRR
ncbi:MAG: thioredoxin domain-containing protein [Enhygromyxa sp.]